MKNATIENLLLIMITAGWSRNSILDILEDIHRSSFYEIEDRLDLVFRYYENLQSERSWEKQKQGPSGFSAKVSSHSHNKRMLEKDYSDLYLKVRKMLVFDLGLNTDEVVELISSKLSHGYIPPLSKKSLENWLERLSNNYSPSEILHAATLVWDDNTKRRKLDWNIRDDK